MKTTRRLGALCLALLLTAACGSDDSSDQSSADSGDAKTTESVRLVTHDSFAATDSVLEAFSERTGITIEVVPSGDAGELVNKSILSKGKPLGDVLYGIDNTFLSRALDEEIFLPYKAAGLDSVSDEVEVDDTGQVTPIDYSDVCVNIDDEGLKPTPAPTTLADLAEPGFKDKFVVQNPSTSSPGLSFLLATVEKFGEPGWEKYWTDLKANGVEVVAGWEEAYNGSFSGGAGTGENPVVVSYASSPPAEVFFSEAKTAVATTSVLEDGCFRQTEFAGILKGTEKEEAAQQVVDFMLSKEFQEDMPLNMFVFPVLESAELPEVFTKFAARPENPVVMSPERIAENRERWISRWTEIVLG